MHMQVNIFVHKQISQYTAFQNVLLLEHKDAVQP